MKKNPPAKSRFRGLTHAQKMLVKLQERGARFAALEPIAAFRNRILATCIAERGTPEFVAQENIAFKAIDNEIRHRCGLAR